MAEEKEKKDKCIVCSPNLDSSQAEKDLFIKVLDNYLD